MPAADQKVDPERYQLVPRCLVFAIRDQEVLLITGAAHKRLWAGQLNGVGGHIEQGEDVLAAAQREFLEETGLHLLSPSICGVILIDIGGPTGVGLFVVRGDCEAGLMRASTEGELAWYRLDDTLYQRPLVEDLPELLPRVLSRQPGDPPFSGRYHYDAAGHLQITWSDER
jgi:8-oxo-dGTP diphosphatase